MKMGERLKALRAKNRLKITECALFLGVSQSTYREWENGRAISGEPYIKIAELFKVSISDLFGMRESDMAIEIRNIEKIVEELLNYIKSTRSRV